MTSNRKKILLSGVKPTGRPHIGNYFGAMKQFVDMQEDYDTLIMVADLHALTTVHDPSALRADILDLVFDYLAIGLDPSKVTLFRQSDVPAHTELAWIFNCLTTMPYLMRAHAYKDAAAKNKEINVGTFDYPMLMAADILLYDTDIVPVGQDQKQHVEYARDTAEKFNRIFGETFRRPEEYLMSEVETITGIDGRKMSKSYNNTIPLFAGEDDIRQAVMKIVTDSKETTEPKDPNTDAVFALHKLFSTDDLADIRKRYEQGGLGYKESKEILIENMNKYLAPLREKRADITNDATTAIQILKNGAEVAGDRARLKMMTVKERVGLTL
ncbi:MAG: tryptophan--tRNA ligase [Candidatus Paceibacterota bacterium]